VSTLPNTTHITKWIHQGQFKRYISKHREQIYFKPHALHHLDYAQRGIWAKETLIRILIHERPFMVGIQKNGRYAIFYKRKQGFLKVILERKGFYFAITTFIRTRNLPRIHHEK